MPYIIKIIQPIKLKILSIRLPFRVVVLKSKDIIIKTVANMPIDSIKIGFIKISLNIS
jgi:hypothetical protein